MSANDIIIDSLTIRLPSGWQGDPVYLARKLSEQIQSQAMQLSSCQQMSVSLRGPFAGNSWRASGDFSGQLATQLEKKKNSGPGRGGEHD